MPVFIIILIVFIVYIGIEAHKRQLYLSEQCKHCKRCKSCKECKKCKYCKPTDIKRKDPEKQKIIAEIVEQSKKEQLLREKLPNNKKTTALITDSQIEKALKEAKSPIDDVKEMQAVYLRESINNLYRDSLCPGDDRLYKKMHHIGIKNRDAMNYRAKYDKYSLTPFVRQELDDNENREWWSQDIDIV